MGRRAAGTALIATVAAVLVGCSHQDPGPGTTSPARPEPTSAVASPTAGASGPVIVSTRASSVPAPSSSARTTTPRTTPPTPRPSPAAPPVPIPRESVSLPEGVATEASGLTRAGAGDAVFWTVDDATGTDTLVAIDERGLQVGTLQVEGMSAGNAEALSSGPCAAGAAARCLFVGDIGDHSGRDDVTVTRVPEPASAVGTSSAEGTTWRYTYQDGSRNAEAMFVAADGSVVVIDKPERSAGGAVRAHHVYRGDPGGGVLALVGTFTPPAPSLPLQSMVEGNVVTDAALQVGAGRTRVLLQFYDQVVQYTAPQRSSDPATFFRWPHAAVEGPQLIQAEGIAALSDGCGYASISEAGPGGSVSRLSVAPCR